MAFAREPFHGGWMRRAAWTGALGLLLLPLLAMQLTDEVNWGPGDFAVAAVLIVGTGAAMELALKASTSLAYRAAAALALLAGLGMIWASLAVGIIGDGGHAAELMYPGMLLLGAVSALVVRLRAAGLSRVLMAMAGAMLPAAGVAMVLAPASGDAPVVLAAHALFAGLFGASAWLFRRAARDPRGG